MKRLSIILIITAFLAAWIPLLAQKIERETSDRTQIIHLRTALNHLTVIELRESVTQVATGSQSFKVEWRENKVFVQPTEADASTNLFIWTASGRQSYELVSAESVDQMHFAIDEEPTKPVAKREDPPQPPPLIEQPKVPAAMLMESTPVRTVGSSKNHQKVSPKPKAAMYLVGICFRFETTYRAT